MVFNTLNIVMLFAAMQGILLALLIFLKYRKVYANRFLCVLLLIYSLILFTMLFGDLGYTEMYPDFTLVFVGFGFWLPPLHYWYARHLAYPKTRFRRAHVLHMLPFFIYEAYAAFDSIFCQRRWSSTYPILEAKSVYAGFVLYNWSILAQAAIYMILSILLLRRYSRYIKDVFSSIDKIKMDWLLNASFLALIACACFFLENLLLLGGFRLSHNFTLSSYLIATYVFALGYLGLLRSEVFSLEGVKSSISRLPELSYQSAIDGNHTAQIIKKYERSGLGEEKAKVCLGKLLELMEERQPYVDANITLNQMAEMLSISAHNLSEILNTQLHQNFYEFVNQYRVEKAKTDLLDPSKESYKILAIAYDVGFSSKSSFNSIFKKHTGMTPSEYRQKAGTEPSIDQLKPFPERAQKP
jgi:AraC-like DNA-binding protein